MGLFDLLGKDKKKVEVNIPLAAEHKQHYVAKPPDDIETRILGICLGIRHHVDEYREGNKEAPRYVHHQCETTGERNMIAKRFTSAGYTISHHNRLGLLLKISW